MKMGCLSGRMGWVELVVMRCGSSTLRWWWKEFWNEGGRLV